MNKEGKSCVIYIRVSTEMQIEGFSLDAQRNVLKRYAEREGMIIKDIYEDAGKSGKSISGRPAFQKLLNDIRNGLEISYILVYKLSRFGRNAADILTSLEYIQSFDINLIATEEGIDSSQTSGKLLISVLSAVSEIERENILEQTMNGRREKARQGGWNGGFAPYGYILKDGKIFIDEEEAEYVKEIYHLYVDENYSFGKIARKFNLLGISKKLMKNRKLANWSKEAIRKLLTNPIYKGSIAFGRRKKIKVKGTRDKYAIVNSNDYIISEGKHEAIVTPELWEQANLKIENNSKKFMDTPYARTYLLSGLLICPCCGGKMSATKNRWTTLDGITYTQHYYRCRNAFIETGHPCTNKSRLEMAEADKFIINFVKQHINNGLFAEKIKEQLALDIDVANIEKEKLQYEKKLDQVIANKESLENTIDCMPLEAPHRERRIQDLNKRLVDLYDVIEEIEANIKDVSLKLKGIDNSSKTLDDIMEILNNFEQLFDSMTDEEKRTLIALLIKEIHFDENFKMNKILLKFNLLQENNNLITAQNKVTNDSILVELEINEDSIGLIPYRKVPNRRRKSKTIQTKLKIPKMVEKKPRPEHYNLKHATYNQIKEFVLKEYGLKVHTRYIAEIKRKYGIKMQCDRASTNPKNPVPHPTKEMTTAIEAALLHFNMITEAQIAK